MSGNQYVYVVETTSDKLVTKNRKEATSSFNYYVEKFEKDGWLAFDDWKLPSGQLHRHVKRGDRQVVCQLNQFRLFDRSASVRMTAWVIKWAKHD
jgi:hypothetical protein